MCIDYDVLICMVIVSHAVCVPLYFCQFRRGFGMGVGRGRHAIISHPTARVKASQSFRPNEKNTFPVKNRFFLEQGGSRRRANCAKYISVAVTFRAEIVLIFGFESLPPLLKLIIHPGWWWGAFKGGFSAVTNSQALMTKTLAGLSAFIFQWDLSVGTKLWFLAVSETMLAVVWRGLREGPKTFSVKS